MAVLSKFPFFGVEKAKFKAEKRLTDWTFGRGKAPEPANMVPAAIANAEAVKKKSKASNYLAPQQTLGG